MRWAVRIRCGDCGRTLVRYEPNVEVPLAWVPHCLRCNRGGEMVDLAPVLARYQQTGSTQTIRTREARRH